MSSGIQSWLSVAQLSEEQGRWLPGQDGSGRSKNGPLSSEVLRRNFQRPFAGVDAVGFACDKQLSNSLSSNDQDRTSNRIGRSHSDR
jgi:hypothetical protein